MSINIKKLISLVLLAGTVLTQVPAMGMDDRAREAQNRKWRIAKVAVGVPAFCLLSAIAVKDIAQGGSADEKLMRLINPGRGNLAALGGAGWTLFKLVRSSRWDIPEDEDNLRPIVREINTRLTANSDNIDTYNDNREGTTKLLDAIKTRNFATMRHCINLGADVDVRERNGERHNALMYAIDSYSEESIRILKIAGANSQDARVYLQHKIDGFFAFDPRRGPLNRLMTTLMQSPEELISRASQDAKNEYKQMIPKHTLQGSLLMYELFNEPRTLVKYLKTRTPIVQGMQESAQIFVDAQEQSLINKNNMQRTGIRKELPRDIFAQTMSFLRKEPTAKEQRLKNILRKSIVQKNEELSQLLVKYGVNISTDEKIALQFN